MESALSLIHIENIETLDYIPIVSTFKSLFDIFQKYVLLPSLSKEEIQKSPYYKHLEGKSIIRSIILLFPGIGNLAVGIYDLTLKSKPPLECRLRALSDFPSDSDDGDYKAQPIPLDTPEKKELERLFDELMTSDSGDDADDEKAQPDQSRTKQEASEEDEQPLMMPQPRSVIPMAVLNRGRRKSLEVENHPKDIPEDERDNEKTVRQYVSRNELLLKQASARLRNDPQTVLLAVKSNPRAEAFAGVDARKNDAVCRELGED